MALSNTYISCLLHSISVSCKFSHGFLHQIYFSRRVLLTKNGVRARTPLNSGCFRLNFYGLTSLSGHKVGMLSPKKDQLKPLGRFNSKLYTKSNYIGVRARTPCTFWDNCQFCQNCVFCVNKLWIK